MRGIAAVCMAVVAVAVFSAAGDAPPTAGAGPAPVRPNVVFVLTDDLSWDLVPYMRNVQRMQRRGTTFANYFVTNSLCCPSRASILTGRYPHNTGVFRNTGSDGGFLAFQALGGERATYATALAGAGYRTALMGKYLNQYVPGKARTAAGGAYMPPGWSEWAVAGNGYPGFGYRMTRNARVVRHGWRGRDYITHVLERRGLRFVRDAVRAERPFMLNVWTFAPHAPFTPAPRDRGRFADLHAPRAPSFDEAEMGDKPRWLRGHAPLSGEQVERIDEAFRARVRAVQAVDRMVGRLYARLRALGVADETYVVFSSDNGFHMGQHRLTPGKLTAYDPDVRVPLIVTGPGVPTGGWVEALAANIDLCPTFAELAGAPAPADVDGRSLAPFLRGERTPRDWRDAILIEHRRGVDSPLDPDVPAAGSGNPPTYEALRTRDALYVEYADGEREHYDLRRDPWELENRFPDLSSEAAARLGTALGTLRGCRGAGCAAAGRLR